MFVAKFFSINIEYYFLWYTVMFVNWYFLCKKSQLFLSASMQGLLRLFHKINHEFNNYIPLTFNLLTCTY